MPRRKEEVKIELEIPEEGSIGEEGEEAIDDLFRRWMMQNMTAIILMETELARVVETVNRFQIPPDVFYMHLKVMETVIEEGVYKNAPEEKKQEFEKNRRDVDRIVAHVVEQSMNLHELLKKVVEDKKREETYLAGYQ